MEKEVFEYAAKADEFFNKKNYKKALKYLNIASLKARYDNVSYNLLEELSKRKKAIFDKLYIKLPNFLCSIYSWFFLLIFPFIFLFLSTISKGIFADFLFLISVISFFPITHPLAHFVALKIFKIKLLGVYLGGIVKLEPTLIVDYASYFSLKRNQRIIFHSIGSISTILTSFFLTILSFLINLSQIVRFLMIFIFIIVLITNLVFSPKYSDLKRAIKESKYKEIKIKYLE